MCLITNQTEPIILTEPLTVYKWLETKNLGGNLLITPRSPYQRTRYYEGRGVQSAFSKRSKAYGIEVIGVHAFTSLPAVSKSGATGMWKEYSPIIVEMVIPSGSEVYYSADGNEIASNHLTWPEGAKIHEL